MTVKDVQGSHNETEKDKGKDLRRRAEDIALAKPAESAGYPEVLSPEEVRLTLHDLRVHQIELEMQNEELRLKQVALDLARERYFDLYDLAPVFYCTISERGFFQEVNLTASKLLGAARETLIRQPLTRFILKEDQDILYLHRQQLFKTGEQQACDLRMVTVHGSQFWAHLEITKSGDTDGKAAYRIAGSDISALKQAEEEREKLQETLNQARKMESVGRLAGGVAHDFNNMLSVILGHAEMLLEQVAPDHPLHAGILDIRRAAERSSSLTRQLLAFASRQMVQPKVLDLNETIESIMESLKRLIGEEIDLDWRPSRNLPQVEMDPSQLDQMLANLLINARDAINGAGKVTIETGAAYFDESYCEDNLDRIPGEYVLLTVCDNGCGMDEATLSNLFEPFYTTKGVGKGTGLGLATVFGIVRQNKGFIDVRSQKGQGTTFRIYLPRNQGKVAPNRGEDLTEPGLKGREVILMVEDEPAVKNMVKQMLENLGYRVLQAGSPGEAVRMARDYDEEIDLLMTDVVLPEMNGLDLARDLLASYPRLRILFMSGYTADVITKQGVLDKGVHFIQKPFSLKELSIKVREVLDR